MPNWYFSKEGLVRTPSRLDGIDYMTETRYRREGTRFIMNCGNKMRLYPFIWMFVVSLFLKLITSQVVITSSCWYRTMNYTAICRLPAVMPRFNIIPVSSVLSLRPALKKWKNILRLDLKPPFPKYFTRELFCKKFMSILITVTPLFLVISVHRLCVTETVHFAAKSSYPSYLAPHL